MGKGFTITVSKGHRLNMRSSTKGEAEIMWVPREDMVADYLTKALQGAEFRCFRDLIMGSV